VRQIHDCGLTLDTIVNGDVNIIRDHEDVTLEGHLADVNLAVSDIKDALAKSVCRAFDSWNHANGSSVDRSSDKLNQDEMRNDFMAGQRRSAFDDRDQRTGDNKRHSLDNSHAVRAAASLEMHESQSEIDEHKWRYIALRYPDMYKHCNHELASTLNTRTNVIEVAGQRQDVINFDEWCKKHDLMSVVRQVIDVPPSIDVNLLKTLIDSSEPAQFGVCVRCVSNREVECIGKESDIDGFISWLKGALRDSREHKMVGSGMKDSAHVNGSMPVQRGTHTVENVPSLVNGPAANASPVTYKRPVIIDAGHERLKFKTAESQLEVEVLKGDLTMHKSQVIVNPANKHLLHCGGAAKAIQTAAGSALINECKDYIRKHKELRTSAVMHTTSGKLPRPINYVIHACGPSARDYPDDRQCFRLLEQTFLNCFVYTNDTLHMQSLALPAISSGIIFVLLQLNAIMLSVSNSLSSLSSYVISPPPRSYVIASVYPLVCLFVKQDYPKSFKVIFMKPCNIGEDCYGRNLLNFVVVPCQSG